MSRRRKIYIAVFLLGVVSLVSFTRIDSDRYFEIAKSLELFSEVYKEVNEYYVDDVNPNQLINDGINEMLSTLDPYTNYYPAERIEEAAEEFTSQYAGLGASTFSRDGQTVVSMITDGSPAMQSGLMIGDVIEKVGTVEIDGMDPEEVELLFKGQTGTALNISVRRFGNNEPIELSFVRDKVQATSVNSFEMLPDNVGYVKLRTFNVNAGREVREAVIKLKEDGATSIILDLRDNGGGLLAEAVNITNIFIPRGEEVVTTRGKISENNATYRTTSSATDTEIPVAVLINSMSASASEIVSGSLQDYDRGIVVGSRSFGKGLVQVILNLPYQTRFKVTSAKYYTPSGRCIQALDYSNRNPDGSVGQVPDSLKKTFYTRNGRRVFDGGGVDPDVAVTEDLFPPVLKALLEQKLIFDFATEYFFAHDSIPPAREFRVNDRLMNDFYSWLGERSFSYRTELQDRLEMIQAAARSEKYHELLGNDIEKLLSNVEKQKEGDLGRYREVIRIELQKEIVKRYYLDTGLVESTLDNDDCIDKAVEVLLDEQQYKKILGITE